MKILLQLACNIPPRILILLTLISSFMVSCGISQVETTPGSLFQETPAYFWTAKEAYQEILPSLATWQEDAIVVSVSSSSSQDKAWGIQPDGRSAYWSFTVHSATSGTQTSISLVDDQVIIGINLQPGFEKTLSKVGQELDFMSSLDSDQALSIANSSGVPESYVTDGMYYQIYPHKPYPLAWTIRYNPASDPYDSYFIVLDPLTGEIIKNDFLSSLE